MLSRSVLVVLASLLPLGYATAQSEPPRCKYVQVGSLPLHYHGQNLALATGGNINGTAAVIVLDTGASDSILTRFGVDKRALRMSPSTDMAGGIGGATRLYNVPVRHFDVGPIRSSGRGGMKVIDEMDGRPDFDAIAGAPFLLQTDVELSLADKKLSFFQGQHCRDAFLAYWDSNAVQVPLGTTESGLPFVQVELDGLRLRALIDTGADASTVSLKALGKLGLKTDSAGIEMLGHAGGVGGKQLRSYRYRFKTFAIGHEQIQHPELLVNEQLPESFEMILGQDFLRAHRLLLAPSQNKVYLSYSGGTPFSGGRPGPWLAKEVEGGNGYAQFALALTSSGADDKRLWMGKAVAAGNPPALRHRALNEESNGRFAEAVALRRRALEHDPFDLAAQLELFSVRVRAGQAQAAAEGLAGAIDGRYDPHWPRPAADYYLGKISLEKLLDVAAQDRDMALLRRCEAWAYAAALLEARGDAAAASVRERSTTQCP